MSALCCARGEGAGLGEGLALVWCWLRHFEALGEAQLDRCPGTMLRSSLGNPLAWLGNPSLWTCACMTSSCASCLSSPCCLRGVICSLVHGVHLLFSFCSEPWVERACSLGAIWRLGVHVCVASTQSRRKPTVGSVRARGVGSVAPKRVAPGGGPLLGIRVTCPRVLGPRRRHASHACGFPGDGSRDAWAQALSCPGVESRGLHGCCGCSWMASLENLLARL